MKTLQRISQLLSNHASLFIILISIVTFYVPNLFVWVKGDVQALTLGIIMLSMGMTLTCPYYHTSAHPSSEYRCSSAYHLCQLTCPCLYQRDA